MIGFITTFDNSNAIEDYNNKTLELIKPNIFKDKLHKKMQIETHTFYIHVYNIATKQTTILMIQILLSNVLDGLQTSVEVLFSIMNDFNQKENNRNVFLKQKVKKPFDIGNRYIKGRDLSYEINDTNIRLHYSSEILTIDVTFDRCDSQSVKILPNGKDGVINLKNGQIEHIYTLGLRISNKSYLKYKSRDFLLINENYKFNTSFIMAMQNGLAYKIVDLWMFMNKVDFENSTSELVMEYGFCDMILSTSLSLDSIDNLTISYKYCKNSAITKEDDLIHVRRYEILKELPRIVQMIMKKLTNSNPILDQYCSGKDPSVIYESTNLH